MKKFFRLVKYEIINNLVTKWFFISYVFFVLFVGIVTYIYLNNLQFFYITFSKGFFINFDIDPIRLFVIPYSKIVYFIFVLYIPLIVYKFFSFEYKSGIYKIYVASKIDIQRIFQSKFFVIFLYYCCLLFFSAFFIIFVNFFFRIEIWQVILFLFNFILIFCYLFFLFFLLMVLLRFSVVSIFLMFILLLLDFYYINFYEYFFSMIYGIVNLYKLFVVFLVLSFLGYFIQQVLKRRFNFRYFLILLFLGIFIVIISNKFLFYQFDLTSSKKYTLPDYLKSSLQNFKGSVSLFLFTSNENYKNRACLKEKFINFRDKVKFNVVNIDKYPSQGEKFNIKDYDNIVLIYDKDTLYLPFVDERHFLASINSFLNNENIDVLILSQYSKYIKFSKYLEEKLKFSNIRLISRSILDKKIKICMIVGLKEKLSQQDVASLMKYIKDGNNVIMLNDPSNVEFAQPLLERIGIEIDTNILKNDSRDMYSQEAYVIRVSGHSGFIKTKSPYYFPITSKILYPDNSFFSDILITFDSDNKDFVPVGIKYTDNGTFIYVNDTDFLRDSYINAGSNSQLLINLIYFINRVETNYKEDNFSIRKNIPDNNTLLRSVVFFMIVIPLLVMVGFIILFRRSKKV